MIYKDKFKKIYLKNKTLYYYYTIDINGYKYLNFNFNKIEIICFEKHFEMPILATLFLSKNQSRISLINVIRNKIVDCFFYNCFDCYLLYHENKINSVIIN